MTADTNPWAQAACADEWETFEAADGGDRHAIWDAIDLCRACPIIGLCLESTLRYEKEHGGASIWFISGGMLPEQRAALLEKRLNRSHQKKATT